MAKTKLRLSSKKDASGKSQVIVKLTIDKTHRPCFKSGVYVSPDWYKPVQSTAKGSIFDIVPPKRGKLNVIEVKEATEAKARLDIFVSRLTKICNEYVSENLIPTHEELEESLLCTSDIPTDEITYKKIVSAIMEKKKRREAGDLDTSNFFAIMENYIQSNSFSYGKVKEVRVLMRILARYEGFVRSTDTDRKDFRLDIDKMDSDTLEDFFDYAKNEKSLSEEYPNIFKKLLSDYPTEIASNTQRKIHHLVERGANTLSVQKRRLKAFFNWLNKKGITNNAPFKGIEIGQEVYGTPFYLTLEERNQVADFDLSARPQLQAQRDIFIFQCLIGCRVSDLMTLTKKSLINGAIEYIPRKTKDHKPVTVRVPLNGRAKMLVEKYKGVDSEGRLFPFISSQKYNEAIKEVLTVCGVKRMVTILNPTSGQEEQRPINEIASSHMARRTFIGNLYRQVKDPNLIGVLSGHTEGSKAFARYRDIDEETKKEVVSLID